MRAKSWLWDFGSMQVISILDENHFSGLSLVLSLATCSSDSVPSQGLAGHWRRLYRSHPSGELFLKLFPRLDKVVKAGPSSLSVRWDKSFLASCCLGALKHSAPDGPTDDPRRWEDPTVNPLPETISHTISCFFKSQTRLFLTPVALLLKSHLFCLCFHPSRETDPKIPTEIYATECPVCFSLFVL